MFQVSFINKNNTTHFSSFIQRSKDPGVRHEEVNFSKVIRRKEGYCMEP